MHKPREHWGDQLGFIMASAGSAIGLGTLWMFPYLTGNNGGGFFIVFYVICTLFIGIPMFIAEVLLGRKAQRGAVGLFSQIERRSDTPWRIVGWIGVVCSFLIFSYYSAVAGWGLNYVLLSLNKFWIDKTPGQISAMFDILDKSGDITLFWQFIFIAITSCVVFQGVRKGVEHWSRLMTISLLFILVLFFMFCISLDGFGKACHFIFNLNFQNFKPSGALEALGLSFFTLSLGQGIMTTYGSYMKSNDNVPKTALIIGGMVIVVSLLASLVIFPIIFTFNYNPMGGPGLVFKTLPAIFPQLPAPLILSTAFFVLLVFTALTSSIALLEVVVANLTDLYKITRKKAVVYVSIAVFIFGIPSGLSGSGSLFPQWRSIYGISFFDSVSYLVSTWLLPIGGFFFSLYVGWIIDKKTLKEAFQQGSNLCWIFYPWFLLIRWLVPCATLAIVLYQSGLLNF